MAEISKTRRLVNPGKKRKMSALQKMFFGSKRQRTAVKRNAGKNSYRKVKKRYGSGGKTFPGLTKKRKTVVRQASRKRNISSIVTVFPNPGRRKTYRRKRNVAMGYKGGQGKPATWTKRKYKSNRGRKVVVINKGVTAMATRRRRRRNPSYKGRVVGGRVKTRRGMQVGRYLYNPGRKRRVKRYKSRRRSNPGVMRHHRRRTYRRNPGMLTGTMGTVAGVIGGVAITKLLCGFLPAQLSGGILGYLATAAVAVAQGKLAGKVSKSASLGHNMMIGGLAYLTAKILNDFLPSVGSYTGIGQIGGSSFYTPQSNLPGNMGMFTLPASTMGAVSMQAASAGVKGLRRTGRLM